MSGNNKRNKLITIGTIIPIRLQKQKPPFQRDPNPNLQKRKSNAKDNWKSRNKKSKKQKKCSPRLKTPKNWSPELSLPRSRNPLKRNLPMRIDLSKSPTLSARKKNIQSRNSRNSRPPSRKTKSTLWLIRSENPSTSSSLATSMPEKVLFPEEYFSTPEKLMRLTSKTTRKMPSKIKEKTGGLPTLWISTKTKEPREKLLNVIISILQNYSKT